MIADDAYTWQGLHVELFTEYRKELINCSLVCRAWGPRCRFYLFRTIDVVSQDGLHSLSQFLRNSSFHAALVRTLNIRSGDADQSWIATVPFHLPKLPSLANLTFTSVDFSQQHPSLGQFYSLLRCNKRGTLVVESDVVTRVPFQISSLAAALRADVSVPDSSKGHEYAVRTASDIIHLNSWPHRLASSLNVRTAGTPEELLRVLPGWRYPVKKWGVMILLTTRKDLGQLSRDIRRVWREVLRVALMGSEVSFRVTMQGVGSLDLRSYAGTHNSSYPPNYAELPLR